MGMQGGIAPGDALSTKEIEHGVPLLRRDSSVQRTHDSAVAARAQVGSAPLAALAYAAGEARPRAFSINDAISLAVLTNPGVGEAAANRRATESTLRQAQGFLLPQVRLDSSIGPEKFTQAGGRAPAGNRTWFDGKDVSVVVRQILFDGFASIHEVWRQSARVNAAAFRVLERTELIALDAAEAYIDVVRFLRLVALANQNVATHEELFSNVQSRFSGGRAGEGDLQTVSIPNRIGESISAAAGRPGVRIAVGSVRIECQRAERARDCHTDSPRIDQTCPGVANGDSRNHCAIRAPHVGARNPRRCPCTCENIAGFRGELTCRDSVGIRNRHRSVVNNADHEVATRRAVAVRIGHRHRKAHRWSVSRLVEMRVGVN